jgi:hypothetical protein
MPTTTPAQPFVTRASAVEGTIAQWARFEAENPGHTAQFQRLYENDLKVARGADSSARSRQLIAEARKATGDNTSDILGLLLKDFGL